MTAFVRSESRNESGSFVLEIRAVNQRFLDLNFRLPDIFRQFETTLRTLISKYLHRGKVDVFLFYRSDKASKPVQINEGILNQLSEAIQIVKTKIPTVKDTDALEILKWPGILEAPEIDIEQLQSILLSLFESTLKEFQNQRLREGAALKAILLENLKAQEKQIEFVEIQAKDIQSHLNLRLLEKIKALDTIIDSDRFEQEIVMLCQKADITEEIDRIKTHLSEVKNILQTGGVVGRRLDFLMQELNREANTLGSKAASVNITNVSVELKVLIEQMREQIQNIE